ncbi:hypothetical protein BS17DRAFT_703434 [Gyrodon lividus]|nr:hypothetical protein BS17DRAFT_703434 [Gyrodon lividus]
MAQDFHYVITDECPSPNTENDNTSDISEWNHHNTQAIGNLHLHLTPNILAKVLSKTTTACIWSTLKDEYGKPSVTATYAEFKAMLDTPIPLHEHPAPAFGKINAHFTQLEDAEFDISPKVQAMILLSKLPSSMDTIAQLIGQSPATLTSATIKKSTILACEQHGTCHSKQPDPKFNQQQ